MKIGSVDLDEEVLVVAEIGNNHEGDFGRAVELVVRAAEAGAQAVKFQTIVPERLVSRTQPARLEQLRRFCFSYEQFGKLAETAARAKVMFMSTPFDVESVRQLAPLVPAFKIASSDNNFVALLEAVAATGKPVLMSTGMAGVADVKRSCAAMEAVWAKRGARPVMVLLHCVSAYPTPPESANLLAMRTLERETGYPVGYSDHTLGIDAAVLSVALGARVIEKHFTLSKTQSEFRDHQLSAEPAELAELVRRVKLARTVLGDGVKRIMPVEEGVLAAARRSAVARNGLPAGHVITREDLDWLRPGGGVAPDSEATLLGRALKRPVAAGEMITADMVR
jgi:N,N'-diacetyllegionaminate synthase